MTGPMVAYALVRELPGITGILVGGWVATIILRNNPSANLEAIGMVIGPFFVNSLARSRPAESESIQRLTGLSGGAGMFLLAWARHRFGGA
jgi:hypothetical protein